MNSNHTPNQCSSVRLNLLYLCGHQKLRLPQTDIFASFCNMFCSSVDYVVQHLLGVCISSVFFVLFFLNAASCREHP